jgi:chemotaxis protein MotA
VGTIVSVIGVTACVLIGFIGPGGPLPVLFQPFELIVIGGSGIFTVVGSCTSSVIKITVAGIKNALKGSGVSKEKYLDLLGLMANTFDVMRKEGVLGIEGDLNNVHDSPRFNKYPKAAHDHHLMETFTGALRLFVDGVVNAHDLEKLMDAELEAHHEEAAIGPSVVAKLADAFPALGIVAAVLGVIITMQYLDGPPSEIGHHVAAALVGTMLGILLSYGYVSPLANKMENCNKEQHGLFKCIQAGLVAFAGGSPPAVALEFARKNIPGFFRPTAKELEELIKASKG